MPSITNVGGSISTAVALTLLAWAIRTVRAASQRREGERGAGDLPPRSRFACRLSPALLQSLVRSARGPQRAGSLAQPPRRSGALHR